MNSETQSTSNTTRNNGSVQRYKIIWKPTTGQTILLISYFKKNRWPNDGEKALIANDINIRFMASITMDQVGSWFETKRQEEPQKVSKNENLMKIYNNFSQEQQDYLINQYKKKKCPNLFEVKEIAQKMHIDASLIQTWYKNTRSLLKCSVQSSEISEHLKQYGFSGIQSQNKKEAKTESQLNKRVLKIEDDEGDVKNCYYDMKKKLKVHSAEDLYEKIEAGEERKINTGIFTLIKEEEEINMKVEDYQDIPSAYGSECDVNFNREEQLNNEKKNIVQKGGYDPLHKSMDQYKSGPSDHTVLKTIIVDRRTSEEKLYNNYNRYVELGRNDSTSKIVQPFNCNNPFVVNQQPFFPLGNQIIAGNPLFANTNGPLDSPTPVSAMSMFNISNNYYIFNMPSIPNVIMMNAQQLVSLTSSPSIQYSNTPFVYSR